MRIKQIVETTAGSVATVAQPMMSQTRESVNVRGLKPVKQLMKGKAKKKGPYANSIVEGKVKELAKDLKDLTSHQFQEKYKQSKADVRADMKKVNEDDISEQDLIVIPGQGRLKRTGFVKHDLSHGEHEGETLKNSLHTIIRVATHLDKRLSLQSEFPEWVSEKIGAVKSNMVTVMDYLISSQEMQQGVAEGEIDTSRMNKQHQDFYNKNPNFKRDDREATSVGGRLATKVTPKTAQVTKKPMTPFEGDMYGDAEVSWEKGGRRAPTGAFRNPNFGNVLQKSVNKHNKAIVKTRQDIGSRVADIGAGGKEHNEKTDAAWDAAKKKVSEGAKVDRFVGHVEKSEEKAGKSKKDAESIAWATANKRGMLDNKNKKK